MKMNNLFISLLALTVTSGVVRAEDRFGTSDFKANSITSRKIKDGTIKSVDIGSDVFSLEDLKLDLGENLSYIRIPLATIAQGETTNLFSDSNVTLTTSCTLATGNRELASIYPTGYQDGSVLRGDRSSTNLLSSTATSSKYLVSARASATNTPGIDGEWRPVFFVALDGTTYYLEIKGIVNMPDQVGKCSFAGYMFKISPEA